MASVDVIKCCLDSIRQMALKKRLYTWKLVVQRVSSFLGHSLCFLESKRNDDSYPTKDLLYKIITSALENNEIPGLEQSLAEQNVILTFVIGGINAIEVREVQEALTERSRPDDIELVLGGTTFLTPNNMCELLLGDYSYI